MNLTNDFGVFWSESYIKNGRVFGEVKILIGGEIYPKERRFDYTLQTIFLI